MANIRKVNRPKQWLVEWRTPAGRKRSQAFAKKHQAEAFHATKVVERARGVLMDPNEGRITVEHWSAEWLDLVRADLKPKTVAGYESLLRSRVLPTFGDWPIADLRPGDVDAWIAGMRRDSLSLPASGRPSSC
jgi:hypothetical protein